MQYAGAGLGSMWFLIQGILLLLLYIFISEGLNSLRGNVQPGNNISYILTGVWFWIPIQEMLQKSTTILTENRSIIKRSGIGISLFYYIPLLQMIVHFIILSIPGLFYLIYVNSLSIKSIFIVPWMIFTGLFIYPVAKYCSMSNVLLKDISPLVRLFLLFCFWTLPIIYIIPQKFQHIVQFHPLLPFLEIFRFLLLPNYNYSINYIIFIAYSFILIIFFLNLERKFTKMIPDHI